MCSDVWRLKPLLDLDSGGEIIASFFMPVSDAERG
jgi:hypothetical protein